MSEYTETSFTFTKEELEKGLPDYATVCVVPEVVQDFEMVYQDKKYKLDKVQIYFAANLSTTEAQLKQAMISKLRDHVFNTMIAVSDDYKEVHVVTDLKADVEKIGFMLRATVTVNIGLLAWWNYKGKVDQIEA